MERRYSRGNGAFYNPKGQLSIHDFKLDENGYVRTGYDNAMPGEERYACTQKSKKWFVIQEELDCFRIGKGLNKKFQRGNTRRFASRIWCIYGFRVVIEYYDTNVLLEVQNKIYDCGIDRDRAISQLVEDAKKSFGDIADVNIVGDLGFVNVSLKK